ncbi:MAG: S1C family serine protease [Candidatus Methylomirabilis sp.]
MKRWLVLIPLLIAVTVPVLSSATEPLGCSEPIPELFRRVSPSVVFISAVAINPFKLTEPVGTVVGSGVIISADGLVLTTSHLVFGRRAITVALDDGRVTQARLLGADPILDLAILRISVPPEGLPKATLGDSDSIRVGEEVVAIGNPFGLEQTLTRGVVSGVNRVSPETPMGVTLPLIQTDAAINPGSSGGPLLNRCGEVIGIATSVLIDAQAIGFAIPINVARQVLPQLAEQGRVVRPWLGMGGKNIGRELRAILRIPLVDGFLVETIEQGSPAEQAGLQQGELPITIGDEQFLLGGDIITAANGQPLDEPDKFAKFVRSLKVGDTVRLTLYRDGGTRQVEFRLPERPILPAQSMPLPYSQRSPGSNNTGVINAAFPQLKILGAPVTSR